MSSVFGPIRHPGEVEAAVVAQLRKWMPTNLKRLGELERINFKKPASYSVVSDYSQFPEQGLPSIVVESIGQIDNPTEFGARSMDATFSVSVFATVEGGDAADTRRLAMAYWWPIIASLMQHRNLGDGIFVDSFQTSGFAGADIEKHRTRVATEHVFYVTLKDFINVGEGPTVPVAEDEDADGEYPLVSSTHVEVTPE